MAKWTDADAIERTDALRADIKTLIQRLDSVASDASSAHSAARRAELTATEIGKAVEKIEKTLASLTRLDAARPPTKQ